MLFIDGVFCPESVSDPRTRAVLCSAAGEGPDLLHPSHLLAGVLRQGDARVRDTLTQALRHGRSLQDVLHEAGDGRAASGPGPATPRTRASFSPTALEALDKFEAALGDGGGALDGVAPELFALCLLGHLSEQERQTLTALDTERAAVLLWEQVAGGIDFRPLVDKFFDDLGPDGTADQPFLLPPEFPPSEDLTWRARAAEAAAGFPFDGEPQYECLFEAITRALHRRQGHHVLLVGERGVGKTTVIADLARRAAAGRIPSLQGRRFLHVDCRYIPADESRARVAGILSHVGGRPELVVTLDGFASLVRSERNADNKAVLLSALHHARCRLIALLTPREFDELFSDETDFAEFFTRIDVGEPDGDVALKILRHFALGLAHKFAVEVDDDAVRQAVVLSANYILNDQLPAKALKILTRICEDIDYERGCLGRPPRRVTADEVVRVVAESSGVPEETLRGIAERSDYEQNLRELIFGQDHAVREVATELGLIKSGMVDPNKPASVMLFLGQTGTGKTEMAKALARFYSTSKRLKTYTLGNCVEPHSVATIIGVPPGYVGHDQGGRLVNDLNADPYCVFLLDEADKAHPDVLQPFLNLFDEGWVADQRGVRAYADKAIFILTTNVGQRMIAELVQQGNSMEAIAARMKEALSQIRHTKSDRPVFTPEFLARIKRVIVFHPLDRTAMGGIAGKLVAELQQTWAAKRGKRLEVPEELTRHVADQAHQMNEKSAGKEGGRVVRKLISEWVEARVQREITQRPGEYRACEAVVLEFLPPGPAAADGTAPAPAVGVRFRPRDAAG
jgi:ATP-dependent Clp protease ATP-binding subunit ClpC